MVEIGKYNTLKIVKDLDFGVYLDGGNGVEILLPTRYVPKNVKPGDEVEVFIYHDNEGRLIATTARPLATVGEFQIEYLQPIITQYFIDNKSEIWLLFLIAHSKR